MVEIKRLKGTRDYDPEKAEILFKIIEVSRKIFPKYGFMPLDTSSLERWEVLLSKDINAGEEIARQTYNFKDIGGKHIGLRYELTISLIRYIVEHKNIVFPFKRYQIGKVYRYEEAKRSRYREFYQLDLDVIGGKSIYYDAELLKIANEFFNKLGIGEYKILINNRKFMRSFLEKEKVPKKFHLKVMRLLDKIDKIPKEEFIKELKKYYKSKEIEETYEILNKTFKNIKDFNNAFGIEEEELEELDRALKQMEVKNYEYSIKIVRGLSYYTGNVFETFVKGYENIGSIASGGRYDNVFNNILKQKIPSVGFSFGVDRIIDILSKKEHKEKLIDVYIAYIPKEIKDEAIKIRNILLQEGIRTFLSYDSKNLTNQIKHANNMGIEHIIIIGKKDLTQGRITYKNLKTGEEKKIKINELKVLKDVVCRH